MKTLSIRQFLIIKTLKENRKSMSSNDLCSLLNISPRTLRYEIKDINDVSEEKIIHSDKNGYKIIHNKTTNQLIKDLKVNDYFDTSKAVTLALLTKESVSVYDIAEECFISESTVFNIIKQITLKFQSANLNIIKKGEIVHIEGSELSKRKMLAHFFFAEIDNLAIRIKNFDEYFSKIQLISINNLVNESLQEININIDTIYFKNIVISLAVSLQRIADGHSIPDLKEIPGSNKESSEYIFLKKFLSKVQNYYSLSITSGDFESMLSFIIGSFRSNDQNASSITTSNHEFKKKIRMILDKTFSHYDIKVSYDQLFDNFVLHIHYLLLRSQKKAFFKSNKDLSLKYSHPYIYDVSIYLTYLIEEEFNTHIHPDEIDLIAIYMGTIIRNIFYNKSKVICICPKYNEIRKLFLNQLKEKFADQLEIVSIVESYSQIKDTDDYDFIITVVKNEYILSNAIYVSPLLTPREIRSIENKLIESINQKKAQEMKECLLKYFDPDLFFYNHSLLTGDLILEHLHKKMLTLGYVPEHFLESVYKREALASSAFFNRFAIPHALDCKGKETKIAYYYSEKPIDWFGEKINLVILLSVKEYDDDFNKIYNLLFDILMDHTMYQNMVACKSFEELLDYVSTNL